MNTRLRTAFVAAALTGAWCVFALGSASEAWSQERRPRRGRGGPPPATVAPAAKPQEEVKEQKEPDKLFAVVGGNVHTMSGPVLRGATILCRNGIIEEVGLGVRLPDGTETLDAAGLEVYPGVVAVRSTGILGGGNPEDSTNLFSLQHAVALAGGLTTLETNNAAAKLTWDRTDGMLLRDNLFITLRYDTNSPSNRKRVREGLDRVRTLRREQAAYERAKARGEEADAPDDKWVRGEYENYRKLLDRSATALIDANTAHEIVQVCELAEQYGIRVVIRGAREGWTVAPRMGRAGVMAVVTPRERADPDDRLNRPNGATIENAAILQDRGVPVSFIPVGGWGGPGTGIAFMGLAGRDLLHLPMEAAFAVRGGLAESAAERAITIDAARILGVDDRVGSIEVGKDADFAIKDGPLLSYMTQTRWTVVDGRVVYDQLADSLLSHIRPGGDRDAPPPEDYWPRRLGDDPK